MMASCFLFGRGWTVLEGRFGDLATSRSVRIREAAHLAFAI